MCGINQENDDKLPPVPLFILYNESAIYYYLNQGQNMIQNDEFDSKLDVVIFIHGFQDSSLGDFGRGLIDAYRTRKDYNIIAIDWRKGALPEYFKNAIPNMKKVGMAVGRALLHMFDNGLDINKVHIVGHSLGAQMAGLIGGYIKYNTHNKLILKRITALDPAFPGFYGRGQHHLTKFDAHFVDVIHTDCGFFGARIPTGTVDFWPNSGYSPQPGCCTMPFAQHACSHSRAWVYYNESILCDNKNSKKFNAVKTDSWKDFTRGNTDSFNQNIFFGLDCLLNLSGNYFFQTNKHFPYAKGKDGCSYEEELEGMMEIQYADAEPTENDSIFARGSQILLYMKHMQGESPYPKITPVSSAKAAKIRKKLVNQQSERHFKLNCLRMKWRIPIKKRE